MSSQQIQRRIGKSGISASAVGLGTWAIGGWMWGGTDEAASIRAIEASIEAGVSLIDTAPAYGLGRSEEIVGKAIRGKRNKVVIATKCGLNWHSGKGNHFFDQDSKPVHRYLGADGEDLAVRLELLEGCHGIGDRRRRVLPMGDVEVDMVGAEPLQALFQLIGDAVGAEIAVDRLAVLVEEMVALG